MNHVKKYIWILVLILTGCSFNFSSDAEDLSKNAVQPLSAIEAYEMFKDKYEGWAVLDVEYNLSESIYTIHGYISGLELIVEIDAHSHYMHETKVRDYINFSETSDIQVSMLEDVLTLESHLIQKHEDAAIIEHWLLSAQDEVYLLEVNVSVGDDALIYEYDMNDLLSLNLLKENKVE